MRAENKDYSAVRDLLLILKTPELPRLYYLPDSCYIFAPMKLNTVIFDMDGLLIDSEPLWQEAGSETLAQFGIQLTNEQYHSGTGLRTPEWIAHWFGHFEIDPRHAPTAIETVEETALQKIKASGKALPGVNYILDFFKDRQFKIGLASSSPMRIIDAVVNKLGIASSLDAVTSAEGLPFGKPHPQVFMNCAQALGSSPAGCLCFEDSFNGLIAAKAARMHCVVVPHPDFKQHRGWQAADAQIDSLLHFDDAILKQIEVR